MKPLRTELPDLALDPHRARSLRRGAAATLGKAVYILDDVADRLLEHLDPVKIDPGRIVELEGGTGRLAAKLAARYPTAVVLALDSCQALLAPQKGRRTRFSWPFGDSRRAPLSVTCAPDALSLPDRSVQLLMSNLGLSEPGRLDAVLREAHRVLEPGGLLMFSALGPDTLRELRVAFEHLDGDVHVHPFLDMHDLGDAAVRAGFGEVVMDCDRLVVEFEDPDALFTDLRSLGARNASRDRPRTLRTPRFRQAICERLTARAESPRVSITLELSFAHAWRPLARPTAGIPVALP